MALYIKTDGTEEEIEPKNGSDFELEELQGFVGGFIEIVDAFNPTYRGKIIVLNEEGKLEGLPINIKASAIYANPNDIIVGNVLVCDKNQVR